MKRHYIFLLFLLLLIIPTNVIYAFSFLYSGPYYARTLNRNASTEVDAASFNPAGLAFLKNNGIYIMAANGSAFHGPVINESNQKILDYANQVPGGKYESQSKNYGAPSLTLVYKKDRISIYATMNAISATGDVVFPEGVPKLDWGYLMTASNFIKTLNNKIINYTFPPPSEFQSHYYIRSYTRDAEIERFEAHLAPTIGAAYRLNKIISVAAGVRGVYAISNTKGYLKNVKLDIPDANPAANPYISYLGFTQYSNLGNILTDPAEMWILGDFLKEVLKDTDGNYTLTGDGARDLALVDTKIDNTGTGYCAGFIWGIDIAPNPDLNMGFRMEYYTTYIIKIKENTRQQFPEKFKESGKTDSYMDGYEYKFTPPVLLGLGISYMVLPGLTIMTSGEYYFLKNRDLDGEEKKWNNGWTAGMGVEYALRELSNSFPDLKISAGYSYNYTGFKKEYLEESSAGYLNSYSIAGGISWMIIADLELTLACMYRKFIKAKNSRLEEVSVEGVDADEDPYGNNPDGLPDTPYRDVLTEEYSNTMINVTLGITYRVKDISEE